MDSKTENFLELIIETGIFAFDSCSLNFSGYFFFALLYVAQIVLSFLFNKEAILEILILRFSLKYFTILSKDPSFSLNIDEGISVNE